MISGQDFAALAKNVTRGLTGPCLVKAVLHWPIPNSGPTKDAPNLAKNVCYTTHACLVTTGQLGPTRTNSGQLESELLMTVQECAAPAMNVCYTTHDWPKSIESWLYWPKLDKAE